MAKLSGMQKGAILYLWRRTYGWLNQNGERKKEEKIPLSEWKEALDSSAPRVSETLSELEKRGIIKRRTADIWGGYYYSMNTDISKWNSNCINLAKLCETVGIPDFGTVTENRTIAETDNCSPNKEQLPKPITIPTGSLPNQTPITENRTIIENRTEQLPKTELPTLYKEILNKDINKKGDEISSLSLSPQNNEIVKATKLDDHSVTLSIVKSERGEKIKEVFARLDKERGYRPTKRSAEAGAIGRMLKHYTSDQIIQTWQHMKQNEFWQGKELFMMTVETQIGAIVNGAHKPNTQQDKPNNDKYIRGQYGQFVEH